MTLIVTIETDDCAHMDNPCDWGGFIGSDHVADAIRDAVKECRESPAEEVIVRGTCSWILEDEYERTES